ncbi:hypothetical protein V8J88_11635 [Massilia sp. W12]|uniref:hypothetical protein n=1 Tax=Massilia sp. W12 TaxID=3126507 RepID=UPI0030CB2201
MRFYYQSGAKIMPGWKPTGGRDSLLDTRLNAGIWNGKPIYIHVTSAAGYAAINGAMRINATRPGGKNGIYLNPVSQCFSPNDAFTLLFFENELYRDSASHCLVFAFNDHAHVEDNPISHGSWVREVIYRNDITFSDITILYRGPNIFEDGNWQS